MKNAKKFLYSDKVIITKEARDGNFNDPFGQGRFTFVTTISKHIETALRMAYLEGFQEGIEFDGPEELIFSNLKELQDLTNGKS